MKAALKNLVELSESKTASSEDFAHFPLPDTMSAMTVHRDEIDAAVIDELAYFVDFFSRGRVIGGDGISTHLFDQPHAGNVCLSVADIDHAAERDGTGVFRNVFIDLHVVADRIDSLVDFEQELRFRGVIDHHGRPERDAVHVVEKGTGVYLFEFVGDGRPFDHLFDAGRVDVMFDGQIPFETVCVDASEPFPHAFEKGNFGPRFAESLAAQGDILVVRLFQHPEHVGQNGVAVLLFRHGGTFRPELFVGFPHGRNEIVFLHVAGSQCAVEIVSDSYFQWLLHALNGWLSV